MIARQFMMRNPAEETLYSRFIPRIVFFSFYFLYFYFIIDPHLRFYAHTTLGDLHLFTQKEVLLFDLWKAPGQLSLLCADFILKYLVYGWAGPALFTISAAGLFCVTKLLTASMIGSKARVIPYLPVLLTLALPLEHDFIYVHILPFFLAIIFSGLYVSLPKRAMVRIPLFLVFAATVYFFGEFVLFIYCAACCIYEIFVRKSFLLGSIIVAIAALVPIAAHTLIWPAGFAKMHSLYNYLWYYDFSLKDSITLYIFMFSVPAAMLLAWLLEHTVPRRLSAAPLEGGTDSNAFSRRLGTLICAAVALAGAGFLFNRFLHAYLCLIPVAGPRLWIHEETMTNLPVCYGILFFAELILALSVSWLLYFWFSRASLKIRFAVFVGLYLSLAALFSLGAFVFIFAVGCILYEWFRNKKPLWILVQAATVLCLTGVSILIFGNTWAQTFLPLNPFLLHAENNDGLSVLRMMQFFPLLMVLTGAGIAWRKFLDDKTLTDGTVSAFRGMAPLFDFLARPLGRFGDATASLLILLTAGLTIGGVAFDFERHARFRLNYLARTGQWDKVLLEARFMNENSLNSNVRMDINRALYQTGRMSDDFFIIPQNPNTVLPGLQDAHVRLQFVETWFELGLISPAEEEAYNILAEGKHPLILLLLAKIHCVKNQPNTARVFLRALEQQPGCASWAKPYEQYLDNAASPAVQQEIKRLREQSFKSEGLMVNNTTVLALLETLLKDNPENRMAFEYWMVYNLLFVREKQLGGSFHLLNELTVPGNHRLYQQAYLQMNMGSTPRFKVDSIDVEPQTKTLFKRFLDAYCNRDPNASPLDAVYGFRNTYFYLDLYLESMKKQ
jgi:hypothetical protein